MASSPETTLPRTIEEAFSTPQFRSACAAMVEAHGRIVAIVTSGAISVGRRMAEILEAQHSRR